MQCDQVLLELDLYLRDHLLPEERAAVESHLSSCPACAEEAVAMSEIGERLNSGLKQWVDEGICPPDLMAQIEASIVGARKQPWHRRWPAYASLAAVAAVFLVALVGVRLNFTAGQMASIPFVGSLAAQLLYPGEDVPAALPNAQVVNVEASTEQNQGKLTVHQVATNPYAMRVQYTLKNGKIDSEVIQPELKGQNGLISLRSLSAKGEGDHVNVIADFDPVAPGQELTLTVGGTWQLSFHN
jgi:hypothetical protein